MKPTVEELKNKYGFENVYVVHRGDLEPLLTEGFVQYNRDVYKRIVATSFPIRRYNAEYNPKFRQIIPYIVLRHGRKLFVTKRLDKSGEVRLVGGMSLGVGGHINNVDKLQPGNIIANCVVRELHEELVLHPNCEMHSKVIGFINDNSNEVSQDHLGVVVLIDISKSNVKVREDDKLTGDFMDLNDIKANYTNLESWSQCVFDVLFEEMSI